MTLGSFTLLLGAGCTKEKLVETTNLQIVEVRDTVFLVGDTTFISGDTLYLPIALPTQFIGYFPYQGWVGDTVRLFGNALQPPFTCTLNGVSATVFQESASIVAMVVPSGATTGAISSSTGGSTLSSPSAFVVTPVTMEPPTYSHFTPQYGGVGDTVTVYGSDFVDGLTTVLFGGYPATVVAVSNNTIEFIVPAEHGNGIITVINGGVVEVFPTEFAFYIGLPSPVVEQVYPFDNYAFVGGSIEIHGQNLGAVQVTINENGITDSTFYASEDDYLSFRIPENTLPGLMTFQLSRGTYYDTFTIQVAPAPPSSGLLAAEHGLATANYVKSTFADDNWANVAHDVTDLYSTDVPFQVVRTCVDFFGTQSGTTGYYNYNTLYEADAFGSWYSNDNISIYYNNSTKYVEFVSATDVYYSSVWVTPEGSILFLRSQNTGLPVLLHHYDHDQIYSAPTC